MKAGLSTLFGFAAALAGVFVFAFTFVIRARDFLPSVAWAVLVAGGLFAISIFFDRRDARLHSEPYERILPRRKAVFSFAFTLYLLIALFGFVAIVVYSWLQLPAGDNWGSATTRLVYCITVVVCGWQTSNAVTRSARRIFEGHIYADYLKSLGEPITWKRVRAGFNRRYPTVWLIIFAAISMAMLLDAHEWTKPALDWEIKSRALKKYQVLLRWVLKHPNTTDLFAGTALVTCTSVLAWRLYRFTSARVLPGDENE